MTSTEAHRDTDARGASAPSSANTAGSEDSGFTVDRRKHDAIHSPAHYTSGGIETRDFIAAKGLNFNRGNIVKYVTRAGLKADELEDLEKAKSYLLHEIALLGGGDGDVRYRLLGRIDAAIGDDGDDAGRGWNDALRYVRSLAVAILFPLPVPRLSVRFPLDDVSRGLRELAGR